KDIQPIGRYPGNMKSPQHLRDGIVDVMRQMVERSAPEYIIPLGGALVPYVVDPKDLQQAVGVPVLNTTVTAINFAELCVRTGMTQSLIAYPRDQSVAYEDFQQRAYS